MTDSPEDSLGVLTARQRAFAGARDWHRLHTPRNLALALCGEAGELAAELQWRSDEEAARPSHEQRQALGSEMADVLIYLVRLADVMGIDLVKAAHDKTTENAERFPASPRPAQLR